MKTLTLLATIVAITVIGSVAAIVANNLVLGAIGIAITGIFIIATTLHLAALIVTH